MGTWIRKWCFVNSGEDIVIVTASGDTVDVVDYDDEGIGALNLSGSPPTAAVLAQMVLGPHWS